MAMSSSSSCARAVGNPSRLDDAEASGESEAEDLHLSEPPAPDPPEEPMPEQIPLEVLMQDTASSDPATHTTLVTRARRARTLAEQRASVQQRARATREAHTVAARTLWDATAEGSTVLPGPLVRHNSDHVPRWVARYHHTHMLHAVGGVFFCVACGSYATSSRASRLADACEPSEDSQHRVPRLRTGSLPVQIRGDWPCGARRHETLPVHSLRHSLPDGWHSTV